MKWIFSAIFIAILLAANVLFYIDLQNSHAIVVRGLKNDLVTYMNSDSTNTSKVKALNSSCNILDKKNKSLLDALSYAYSVKSNDATSFKTITRDTFYMPLYFADTIVRIDTVTRNIKHNYFGVHTTKWDSFSVSLDTNNTLEVFYKVKNSYNVWSTEDKNATYVYVQNINPNTITTELVAYRVEKKKPKRGLWLAGGFLAGLTLGILK